MAADAAPRSPRPAPAKPLDRCPQGYIYRLERETPALGRILAAIAVAATDIFGTARPALGNATVTVTTPDGSVTVFRNAYDEVADEHVVKLVEQHPAPAPP